MNKGTYYGTLLIFYICKFVFFTSSIYLFYYFAITDKYLSLFLASLFLYSSFIFYGFEIRFKKMRASDIEDNFKNTLENLSRRERRKTIRKLTKWHY